MQRSAHSSHQMLPASLLLRQSPFHTFSYEKTSPRRELDEIGLITISGPNLFEGYLDERHNLGLWIDIDGQRWLNTGHLGRQDAQGYFWLTGRKKELIIRGGHNIDPKQIEEALQAHPAVALAAAIGSPDAYSGEVPVAYVQLRPGQVCNVEELEAFAHLQHQRAGSRSQAH